MKTTLKSLLMVSLLFAATTASAQRAQDIEDWMSSLISKAIDNKVEVTKSLGQERDIQKEGTPLKWRCDIYQFILPKKQRPLLEEMIKAFEANGHDNPNCYSVNSMRTGNGQQEGKRNLMIGEDPNRYVTIGESYGNYMNINILDVKDTTKTHRYAYALEWKESSKSQAFVRYIVTYAKIPSVTTTITQSSWPYFNLGRSRIKRGSDGRRIIVGDSTHIVLDGKTWPLDSVDYIFRDAQKRMEQAKRHLDSIHIFYDSLKPNMDFDKWIPRDSTALINETLNNGNFLLNFYNLKDYYWKHKDTSLTAISIYELCKLGREHKAFTSPDSTEEWEQLMKEIDDLIEVAKTETDRKYFQMARSQLEQMKRK